MQDWSRQRDFTCFAWRRVRLGGARLALAGQSKVNEGPRPRREGERLARCMGSILHSLRLGLLAAGHNRSITVAVSKGLEEEGRAWSAFKGWVNGKLAGGKIEPAGPSDCLLLQLD